MSEELKQVDIQANTNPLFSLGSAMSIPIGILIYSLCQFQIEPFSMSYAGIIYMGFLLFSIYLRKLFFKSEGLSTACTNYINRAPVLITNFFIALFTLVYCIIPMIVNNNYQWPILFILLVSAIASYVLNKSCYTGKSLIGDICGAFFCGVVSFGILTFANDSNLYLFISTPTKQPATKQKLVCTVRKNGEIVNS